MVKEKKLPAPWICSECQQPIPLSDGIAEIFNANPELGRVGGYPRDATVDEATAYREAMGDRMSISAAELAEIALPDPNIGLRVVHAACAGEDTGAYHFTAPNTLDGWIGWVLHLTEKKWMGRYDLVRMISFWYVGHGLERPQAL